MRTGSTPRKRVDGRSPRRVAADTLTLGFEPPELSQFLLVFAMAAPGNKRTGVDKLWPLDPIQLGRVKFCVRLARPWCPAVGSNTRVGIAVHVFYRPRSQPADFKCRRRPCVL